MTPIIDGDKLLLEQRIKVLEGERDELKDDLIFVERWAVHHALKPSVTPEQALACIAHYPPIRAITKAYSDGVFSSLPDPYAERDAYAKAADDQAMAHKVERDNLSNENALLYRALDKVVIERDRLREAAQMALAYHCWREYGDCRVDDKPLPMAHEVEKKLRDALGEKT
jgi:hypothetical protein